MKRKILHIIEWAIALAACGYLVWRLATYDDYVSLLAGLRAMNTAQWCALIVSVLLMPVNMTIEAWRWRTLMNEGESRVESQESRVERCYNQAHAEWLDAMRGLENEPERGSRCARCFYYRMLATAKKAQELGIPYFATTLASSRWKNLEQINAAGEKAAEDVGCQMLDVHFWAQNWRKEGLQERRNALLKEYAFYNQQYCGCEFSMRSTK